MRDAPTLLVQYAEYHRDRRNIATHLLGIPLIVLAIGVLLARPALETQPAYTWAWLLWGVSSLWYLSRGHLAAALAVIVMNGALFVGAHALAQSTGPLAWLWGVGLFVVGWVFQFVGHFWEGRKPAFVDDLVGLLVGPMFIAVELLMMLGLLGALKARMETEAGPLR